MSRMSVSNSASRGAKPVREACDESATIKEDRKLRALANKLAAYAYWQAARYRVFKDVKGEMADSSPSS